MRRQYRIARCKAMLPASRISTQLLKLKRRLPENVMEMRIVCPPYRDQDDEMEKRYVQECIYRYCGFAKEEMDFPRSYTEFLRSDKK